jgi:hypothetical protein
MSIKKSVKVISRHFPPLNFKKATSKNGTTSLTISNYNWFGLMKQKHGKRPTKIFLVLLTQYKDLGFFND